MRRLIKLKIIPTNELSDKVAIVVGTRPSIIKMAPIIRELNKQNIENFVVHTSQHYSPEMDRTFFIDLELDYPKYHLKNVRNCYFHGEQTARMIQGIEQILLNEQPKVVLVCGDANTNLAAGLAARKLHIIVGHVESGLRSYDWTMPEEHNRIILDHICELLFAPTRRAYNNLLADNVRGEIHLTGNTIVDAVVQNLEIAKRKSRILSKFNLVPKNYGICTIHREENVDVPERLKMIIKGLSLVTTELNLPIIFPIHPRTKKRINDFGLIGEIKANKLIKIVKPLGYLDFLLLLYHSKIILTDSGGIQEESCIIQIPCVTLRDNTERPETIEVGANKLAGTKPSKILSVAKEMAFVRRQWKNPFGDGKASQKIVKIVNRVLTSGVRLYDPSISPRLQKNCDG